jgi:hypothetical protein
MRRIDAEFTRQHGFADSAAVLARGLQPFDDLDGPGLGRAGGGLRSGVWSRTVPVAIGWIRARLRTPGFGGQARRACMPDGAGTGHEIGDAAIGIKQRGQELRRIYAGAMGVVLNGTI